MTLSTIGTPSLTVFYEEGLVTEIMQRQQDNLGHAENMGAHKDGQHISGKQNNS